jgi:hypothetical protein
MNTEIQNQQISNEPNFDKPEILISTISENIVLSTGVHNEDYFEGTLLCFDDTTDYQRFSNNWNKLAFKKFIGKITISND